MSLSDEDRAELERRLLQERSRVVRALDTLGARFEESSRDASGDLSVLPLHPADLGTDVFLREQDAGEEMRLAHALAEIDAALERLYHDPARFGQDERNGTDIPFARLLLVPWARQSIDPTTPT
jgi:RNA polymerase-binding transcription factor DksA